MGRSDHKTVLRRLYDVINVMEALGLLTRPVGVRRGVQWVGPSLTDVVRPERLPGQPPLRWLPATRNPNSSKRKKATVVT